MNPLHRHTHTAEIMPATDEDLQRLPNTYTIASTLYDTILMIWDMNQIKTLERVCVRDDCLPSLSTLFFTSHITKCPAILEAVLEYSRNDPSDKGFLQPSKKYLEALLPFIEGIFKEPINQNDCILTCTEEQSNKYRSIVLNHLNSRNNLEKTNETIRSTIANTIDDWYSLRNENNEINLTEFTSLLASKAISIFLGYEGSYEKICFSVNVFFNEVLNYSLPLSFLFKHPDRLKQAQDILEEAIKNILSPNNESPFVQELLNNKEFTPLQKKVMVFILFAAGQETTASLLNYLILKISMDSDKQNIILNSLSEESSSLNHTHSYIHNKEIQEIFRKTIKEFTPVPALMRGVSKNVKVILRNISGNIEREYLVRAGEKFNIAPFFAAKEVLDEANNKLKMLWFPFGNGFHKCPGRGFATNNIINTVAFLIRKFQITTQTKPADIKFIYTSTLRLDKDMYIVLENREMIDH